MSLQDETMATTRIAPVDKTHGVAALGCWTFGGSQWGGQNDSDSIAAMETALRCGMNHFDTAAGYGQGHSETIVGEFLKGRRDDVFLASKGWPWKPTEGMSDLLEGSLKRLGTDMIDLYYIHWPSKQRDPRPLMEELERAREQGKIRAIGVSNFSVEQMQLVQQVGRIDAHQLCYNLLWRFPERDVIPHCVENNIAVVTYSSIAQGILAGKFPRQPEFREGDSRAKMVLFEDDVWPSVYECVEQFKQIAGQIDRPLTHSAIRWVAAQPGVTSVLIGARDAKQVEENAAAMAGEIPADILDRLTQLSDAVMPHIPDVGNIFRYYP